jgi:hypothetical protein
MHELGAAQREYQRVTKTTTEERRKVGNNMPCPLEKRLEEQTAKTDGEYDECMSEDFVGNLREITGKHKNADLLTNEGKMLIIACFS